MKLVSKQYTVHCIFGQRTGLENFYKLTFMYKLSLSL